jgi:Kef-type K+ transport system membrane component KefB
MEDSIFIQLSLVLAIAAGVSIVMRLLRQPLIVGYILSGVIVGPTLLNIIHDRHAFESFSEIGIALLLFIVGLGLNVSVIRATGKPVMLVFLTNAVVMLMVGLGLSGMFGLTRTEGLIAGLGLLFSSTIVIIKALNDKREQNRLYGQIAIGVILVEDIAATLALLYVAAAGNDSGGSTSQQVTQLVGYGALLTAGLVAAGSLVLPHVSKFFARSQELLFAFALAWAFGVASLFDLAGFSLEVGALFAGVTLATLPYAQEISTRLKPLRDFFLVLFFISLGEQLDLTNIKSALVPALVFSALAIALKPLAIMASLGVLGYTKQTGFKAAIHLSQISEFSVILAVLALNQGLVTSRLVDILTLTALITIAVSTYLMKYDDSLYKRFANRLSLFERHNAKVEKQAAKGYELVLFGYHKGGHEFVRTFREMDKHYIVVDYNPEVIETLEQQHINHVYGDATDYELLEEIGINKAELVVSTIPDLDTNKTILHYVLEKNTDAIFICHASDYDDAAKLYEAGASYVMLPHFIGSERMSNFIRRNGSNKSAFDTYRKNHLIELGKVATLQ